MLHHLEARAIERAVVPFCKAHGIAVGSCSQLGSGRLRRRTAVLEKIAAAHGACARQVIPGMVCSMRTLALGILLAAAPAAATPGPDSVVVIANANVPESVALATRYAAARDVPQGQVCALDLPVAEDISLAEYETRLLAPLRACLGDARARIEAAVLIRGVPLRVDVPVPDGDGTELVSLAAALGVWESTLDDGTPLLGQPPGTRADCGGVACYAARWRNPYRTFAFDAGWAMDRDGVRWRPLIVTMLHGRTFADAERMLDSALAAEEAPPSAEILFMDGADPARGVLDAQYDLVMEELAAHGVTNVARVPFNPDLSGRTLAAFFVGTASLGTTIEGNTFVPGSLADNVTSYGAHPVNFQESGENQVSIARWVAQGVAGAHGTVEEPLNNCFPHRHLIVAYVEGATIAEAFHEQLPFVYWRNLVLGDPMAAPFASRPELALELDADTDGSNLLAVSAVDPLDRGLESLAVYLDGVELARTAGDPIETCVVAPAGEHQLLVVARAAFDPSEAHPYREKGWIARTITSDGSASDCIVRLPDAGGIDAGADAGRTEPPPAGCGCRAARSAGGLSLVVIVLVFAACRASPRSTSVRTPRAW